MFKAKKEDCRLCYKFLKKVDILPSGVRFDRIRTRGLSDEQIQASLKKWREVAMKYHPDKPGGNTGTFKRIGNCVDIIVKNPESCISATSPISGFRQAYSSGSDSPSGASPKGTPKKPRAKKAPKTVPKSESTRSPPHAHFSKNDILKSAQKERRDARKEREEARKERHDAKRERVLAEEFLKRSREACPPRPSKRSSSGGLKCTIGKNGVEYWYRGAKRVSKPTDTEGVKCSAKS